MPIQSMMREVDGRDRLLYVDGLRAVAVLSVVVYHAWKYGGHGAPPIIARVLQMGAHGVDLFFILSGFCLAYPCLKRVRAHGSAQFSLAAFAAKRITRIVPPYWLALFICVGLGFLNVLEKPPSMLDSVKQLFFLDGSVRFVAGPFWSLPVEFRWYFLFPLALVAYVRAPRFVLAVAVGCYVLFDQSRLQAVFDFGMFPAFLAGIWVADLHLTRSPLQRHAALVFLVYGLCAFALEPDDTHQFYGVDPLGIGSAMAFVVLAGTFVPLRNLLSNRVFTTIGGGSYGIYLLHDPIVKQLEMVHHVAPWFASVIAVVLALGFSWLCERPFVSGPARAALLGFLEPRLGAVFAWLGMPAALALSGTVVELDEPQVEPENVAGQAGYSPAAS
jgi:peptidoglycan/LPS O-acetylase OafA/YrhL